MPKLIQFAWVKNVNNAWIHGCKTGVWSSPFVVRANYHIQTTNGKLQVVHAGSRILNTFMSTFIFAYLYPLNISYTPFPHPLLIEPQMKN